jgi:hypothetical protein
MWTRIARTWAGVSLGVEQDAEAEVDGGVNDCIAVGQGLMVSAGSGPAKVASQKTMFAAPARAMN